MKPGGFQGGGVHVVGLLEQYHIGLGGGKVVVEARRSRMPSFGSVRSSIESENREVLIFGIGGCPP